ncbi:MAG: diguanylate cyclase [Massilia sp.]
METPRYSPPAGFIDLLVDAVCAVDADGRFVYVSAAAQRIFGYTPEEMVGTRMIDMVAPEDRARTLAAVTNIMGGATLPHFQNRYMRKDGRRVTIMWSARWSEKDQLRIAVARDISDHKRSEGRQAAMHAISEAAHTARDLATLFPMIQAIVAQLLWTPGFTIVLRGANTAPMELAYHCDEFGQTSAALTPAALTLCVQLMNSGKPLLLSAPGMHALSLHVPAPHSPPSPHWLGVPLVSGSGAPGALGALAVARPPEMPPFTEQDRELLQFVSIQVATAIERTRMHEQLLHLAQHDTLTGLPNRQLFHDRLEGALARARRAGSAFALLYIDLDKFKQVNDRYGHAAGDLLLQEVANRARQCVRAVDTVARIGGDEFVVLLESIREPEDAQTLADAILSALARPITIGRDQVAASASIGIAIYPLDGKSAKQLLKRADSAMYRCKNTRAAPATAPAAVAQAKLVPE